MVEASMEQEEFFFPSLYYTQLKKIGETGRRVAFMFLDSMIYLCAADPTNMPSEFASF